MSAIFIVIRALRRRGGFTVIPDYKPPEGWVVSLGRLREPPK